MGNFIFGLILTVGGFCLVAKTEAFLGFIGPIDFFENYLRSLGGTRMGLKFFGLLFIFIGIMLITGLYGLFMTWILSPILNLTAKQ